MARKRRVKIDAELSEISDALRTAIGTNAELPIRLVYELKSNPEESLASVRERLGITSRTATRWLKILTEEGFTEYTRRRWRVRSISAETATSEPSHETVSDDSLTIPSLMSLLRQAPQSPDEATWGREMKAWIRKLLPEIDMVGVSIVNNVSLFGPDTGTYGVLRSDYAHADTAGSFEPTRATVRDLGAETHWKRVYLNACASQLIASGDYHPPSGADYYYQYGYKREFIGCLVLLRSSEKPPLGRKIMTRLHTLEPVIALLMANAVARFQVWNPLLAASSQVFHRIDPNDVLTKREKQVVSLHLTGESYQQIAEIMSIDEATVASHTNHILEKLRFKSVKEMMAKAQSSRGLWKSKDEDE